MTSNPFAALDKDYELSMSKIKIAYDEDAEKMNLSVSTLSKNKNKSFTKKRENKELTYEDKINIIQEYFGVSKMCAIYLYHRRRRGIPWCNINSSKYLEWSIQLQNALIHLDQVPDMDWRSLEFGYESIQFIKHNIDIHKMTKKIMILSDNPSIYYTKPESADTDGFIPAYKKKINITIELNKMGLLPRSYCH